MDASHPIAIYDEKKHLEETGGGDAVLRRDFFMEEYALDHRIATLSKPFIALLDGVTSTFRTTAVDLYSGRWRWPLCARRLPYLYRKDSFCHA